MAYSLMIAPIDFAGHQKIAARQFFDNYAFFELTPKQAKEYFLWYKSEIPNRIALLWEYMKQECPEAEPFDYSPESLIPLWEWYETKIEQVPMTAKEIEYQVSKYPKWIEEEIRKETMKYTDETLSLALDISIYLGEIILKSYPNLYWGYRAKPKNEFSALHMIGRLFLYEDNEKYFIEQTGNGVYTISRELYASIESYVPRGDTYGE